eukprot:7020132-Lingulodinium_polyedra.AAC.1
MFGRNFNCNMPTNGLIQHVKYYVLLKEEYIALHAFIELDAERCSGNNSRTGPCPHPARSASLNYLWNKVQ